MLGLLLNILAADEKYPLLKRGNLMVPIQIQLSQKHKNFLNFLLHFGNLKEILNILRQKVTIIDFVISKLRGSENVVR